MKIKTAYFNFMGRRQLSRVVKENPLTVWVRIMLGATEYTIIKRHRKKHRVWVI